MEVESTYVRETGSLIVDSMVELGTTNLFMSFVVALTGLILLVGLISVIRDLIKSIRGTEIRTFDKVMISAIIIFFFLDLAFHLGVVIVMMTSVIITNIF